MKTQVHLGEDDGLTLLSWPPQLEELRDLPVWPTIEKELADLPDATLTAACVVNWPDARYPFTRTIETKHATGQRIGGTVVSESSPEPRRGTTPYPPWTGASRP